MSIQPSPEVGARALNGFAVAWPLTFASIITMKATQGTAENCNLSTMKRLRGIAIVLAIYGAQLIVLKAIIIPLPQSPIILIPALLIVVAGWLVAGITLGATVLSRSLGGMRFVIGFALALLLSLLLVIGIIEFLNNLPPTYDGP